MNLLAAAPSVAAFVWFGALAPSLRRAGFVELVVLVDTPAEPVPDFTGAGTAFLVGLVVTAPLHEAVHGAAANALGGPLLDTGGAAGDPYAAAVALRTPPGTPLDDADTRRTYVFDPAEPAGAA